jgi:hypothetical protein
MSGAPHSWRSLAAVALAALLVLYAADVALRRVTPVVWLRQVDDGVRDFKNSNPRILSISSSHGRSMDVVAQELSRRAGRDGEMVSVAMEAGKATHFRFVLQERLRPLVEERRADGTRVRERLRQAIIVTEWWDSCAWEPGRPIVELASHAWTPRHFLADVARHGITPTNRNYLRWRWKRLFSSSVLVTDRGRNAIVKDALARLRGIAPGRTAEEEREFVQWWLRYNESGADCIFSPAQMAAYEDMVSYLKSQGLQVSIVIFARKPGTLTEESRTRTLARYAQGMQQFAARHGVRLIDIATRSPLTDEDFMADFDHVNAAGNRKLARWLLDGDFSFLQCESGAACTAGPEHAS